MRFPPKGFKPIATQAVFQHSLIFKSISTGLLSLTGEYRGETSHQPPVSLRWSPSSELARGVVETTLSSTALSQSQQKMSLSDATKVGVAVWVLDPIR